MKNDCNTPDCEHCGRVERLNKDIETLHYGLNKACVENAKAKMMLKDLQKKYTDLLHCKGWAEYGKFKDDNNKGKE